MTDTAVRDKAPRKQAFAVLFNRDNTLLGVLIVFVALVTVIQPRFLQWGNIVLILASAAILGVVALGEFLVIISGAVDISIGAIVAVSAVITSVAIQAGIPAVWSAVIGVFASAALGWLNGILVAVAGLPSVVVTLATLGLIRGLLSLFFSSAPLTGGQESFGWLWTPRVLDLPPAVLLFAGLALLVGGLLRWTQLGRNIFAVGSNESAARIAGVPVRRIRVLTFAIAAVLASIAGLLIVGQQSMIQLGQAGSGFEFLAIGAVVLGGVDIFGGSGKVRGAVIGVLLLYSIYNAMVLAGIDAAWQDAVVGLLILVAVIIDTNRARFSRRSGRR